MSLKDQITEDMKTAMRAKDSARLGTIRLLQAAMKQKEVDERVTLDDVAVIAIVDKLIKQRKDSISAYDQAGRQDLAAVEAAEIDVLKVYLPARLSAEEIAAEVRAIVTEVGATGPGDMGKVMGVVKTRLAGKADMGLVSSAVKSALGSTTPSASTARSPPFTATIATGSRQTTSTVAAAGCRSWTLTMRATRRPLRTTYSPPLRPTCLRPCQRWGPAPRQPPRGIRRAHAAASLVRRADPRRRTFRRCRTWPRRRLRRRDAGGSTR